MIYWIGTLWQPILQIGSTSLRILALVLLSARSTYAESCLHPITFDGGGFDLDEHTQWVPRSSGGWWVSNGSEIFDVQNVQGNSLSLAVDIGQVWQFVLTEQEGILINTQNGLFRISDATPPKLEKIGELGLDRWDQRIDDVYEQPDGTLLIATPYNAFSFADGKLRALSRDAWPRALEFTFPLEGARLLAQDRWRYLLVGDDGIVEIDSPRPRETGRAWAAMNGSEGELIIVARKGIFVDGVRLSASAPNEINDVAPAPDGKLWIASGSGLFVLDPRKRTDAQLISQVHGGDGFENLIPVEVKFPEVEFYFQPFIRPSRERNVTDGIFLRHEANLLYWANLDSITLLSNHALVDDDSVISRTGLGKSERFVHTGSRLYLHRDSEPDTLIEVAYSTQDWRVADLPILLDEKAILLASDGIYSVLRDANGSHTVVRTESSRTIRPRFYPLMGVFGEEVFFSTESEFGVSDGQTTTILPIVGRAIGTVNLKFSVLGDAPLIQTSTGLFTLASGDYCIP